MCDSNRDTVGLYFGQMQVHLTTYSVASQLEKHLIMHHLTCFYLTLEFCGQEKEKFCDE